MSLLTPIIHGVLQYRLVSDSWGLNWTQGQKTQQSQWRLSVPCEIYIKLQKPSRILYGPERKPLVVMGKFEQELICRGSVTKQQIFVVKGLTRNLLYTADTLSRAPIAPTQVDETPQQEAEQWMHAVVMGFQTTSTVTIDLNSPQTSSNSLLNPTIFIILPAVHITHRETGWWKGWSRLSRTC